MLCTYQKMLSQLTIVLASSSPRRKELCSLIKLPVKIIPSDFEEDLDPSSYPSVSEFVIDTAYHKAARVRSLLDTSQQQWDIIIGVDTTVVADNKVIGKPRDREDAIRILSQLSGATHSVCSGVVILHSAAGAEATQEKHQKFSETTQVTFSELSQECAIAYVDTGEPLDKAGAYGYQGMGGNLVTGIVGDFYNVVGLPIHKLSVELCKILDSLK